MIERRLTKRAQFRYVRCIWILFAKNCIPFLYRYINFASYNIADQLMDFERNAHLFLSGFFILLTSFAITSFAISTIFQTCLYTFINVSNFVKLSKIFKGVILVRHKLRLKWEECSFCVRCSGYSASTNIFNLFNLVTRFSSRTYPKEFL